MTRENFLSLLRNLLTIAGGYLIGKNFLGTTIDDVLWQGLLGLVMAIVGFVMSVKDKQVDEEKIQGIIRHTVSTIGGIFVGTGKLSAESLTLWTGFILSLVPIIQGLISRRKAGRLQTGEIKPHQLKS
jgi:uncharacterized membrane protein YfcA